VKSAMAPRAAQADGQSIHLGGVVMRHLVPENPVRKHALEHDHRNPRRDRRPEEERWNVRGIP